MAEAAPHHLELIYQLLVQGTHFWVHQLLMDSQANSKDMDLCGNEINNAGRLRQCEERTIVWLLKNLF